MVSLQLLLLLVIFPEISIVVLGCRGVLFRQVSFQIAPRFFYRRAYKSLLQFYGVTGLLRHHDRIQAPSVFARHCEIGLRHSEQPVRE